MARVNVFLLSLYSDHDCIGCMRKINHQKFAPRNITCRNYSRYDPDLLNKDLEEQDWSPIYNTTNSVDDTWRYFKDVLLNVTNKHAPFIQKQVKGQLCPWLSSEIKELMNDRDKAMRKSRRTKSDSDIAAYKLLRNRCNNKVRSAKNRYHKDLLIENKNNPAKFWSVIKSLFPSGKSSESTSTHSTSRDDLLRKSNSFCQYFSRCAKNLKDLMFPLQNLRWKTPNFPFHKRTEKVFTFGYVSTLFVEKELKSLKRKKATGADNIPPGVLKDAARSVAKPLAHIINHTLNSSTVPADWKIAKVIPLHKKGDKSLESNYRPISVLPVCSKIMEKAVHHQLIKYLESEKLLSDQQYGYRKCRSTELASIHLTDDIRKSVDKGELVGALFVDLSKAFDTLSHDVLIRKLRTYGIRGIALQWFTSYLFDRKQFCVIDGVKSSSESIVHGVPQGSILGPVLFLLYFNDFGDCLKHSRMIQFADDTVLYCANKAVENIEIKLNEDLKCISEYFNSNELIMNVSKGKTESMLFGTQKRIGMVSGILNLEYNGVPLSSTTEYKYLGVSLDQSLTLSNHFNKIYRYASNKLYFLNLLKASLTRDATSKIYTGIILPGLLFSSPLLLKMNTMQLKKLKSLDNRANKITCCPVPAIRKEIERRSCLLVKKCVLGNTCEFFSSYFKLNKHGKNTRNGGFMVVQPLAKLVFGKSGFYSSGASVYNSLPLEIRKCNSFFKFKESLKTHFTI